MGEVLILLGRKLGQLTSRSTRVAFKRAVGGGERIQVILGKGLVLCLCSGRAAQKRGKPIRRREVGKSGYNAILPNHPTHSLSLLILKGKYNINSDMYHEIFYKEH